MDGPERPVRVAELLEETRSAPQMRLGSGQRGQPVELLQLGDTLVECVAGNHR